MKYKMFVCDLDGTLLDDHQKISKENLAAIKEMESKGIKFVVATGRIKYALENFLELLDYKMPLISSNGSTISDIEGKTIYTEGIPAETARRIIKLGHEHGIYYTIHTLDGMVSEDHNKRVEGLEKYNNRVNKEHRIPVIVDPLLYDNLENYAILNLSMVADTADDLSAFQSIINKEIEGVDAAFSGPRLLDITSPKASKGSAVLELASRYNIDPKEVVVIGDNENDISMFKVAGLPLTLENASDSVKEFATHITIENNLAGVADGIRRFVLK